MTAKTGNCRKSRCLARMVTSLSAAAVPGGSILADRANPTAVNVVELSVTDGKLIATDPAQPTYIDLKPVREPEK